MCIEHQISVAHRGARASWRGARHWCCSAVGWGLAGVLGAIPVTVWADSTQSGAPHQETSQTIQRETTVTAANPDEQALPKGRASSTVRRADLERRLPRSAPDALRYEPGVFVQQTGHSQGSAFIRGLTGQQTLLLFDGIRVNNSTYRQGPNQYFFTLDSHTIDSIDVLRGGGSTRFGSDALGGVLLAHPLEPSFSGQGPWARPRLQLRGASADLERGGRLQLEAGWGERVGFVGGIGARRVSLLESSGPVRSLIDGGLPDVPRFAPNGRTQLGTGFDELTADGRTVWRLAPGDTLTLAGYVYRQYDAPRTDQCAPPYAPYDECLKYEQQFRTLAYAAWDTKALSPIAQEARVTLSWQRQHERRRHDRPASFVYSLGIDDVDSWGVTARAHTRLPELPGGQQVVLKYGVDTYLDLIRSESTTGFTDVDLLVRRSRGQYLDGSWYLQGGVFLDGEFLLTQRLMVRAGTRASWVAAHAPGDSESGSAAIDRSWWPLVGHVGAEWTPLDGLALLANVDRSFRAPNLDDLTSRQQTGPGFQFENPHLLPEKTNTLELGARVRTPMVTLQFWAFTVLMQDAVGKRPRDTVDCPLNTPQCVVSWSRLQLVNARAFSELRGLEASVRLRLLPGLVSTATATWTWGEGPNLAEPPSDPSIPFESRVPLSRVPPLNGTVELIWMHPSGLGASGALRWATDQTRLAIADRVDARIPLGGTPGFATFDARVSYRMGKVLTAALVMENLLDTPYRYHGSSVNGPSRGVVLSLEGATP
ncbi:TonB-dependent receptor [Archangium gephyra]|uniref:TonB-dependent receptor n=1 Tax=Archangium gephyra TaxID=48 RepID=UPI0035D4015A